MIPTFQVEMRLCEKFEFLAHELDSFSMRTINMHDIRFHDFFVAIDGHGIDMNLPIFSDYLGADGFGKHNLAGSVVEAFLDGFILRGDVLRDKKKVLNLLCCDFYDQSCG